MIIRGTTALIAHIGYPTHGFKSPLIYNAYFEQAGIDAVVVPMGCRTEHFPSVLAAVFTLTNIRGALITMPHKVAAASLVDEASPAVRIAGACNAVRRMENGRLQGDLFDGEGFVQALRRKGCPLAGARVLIAGAGGVGSAIAASLAAAGARAITLFDIHRESARALANRLASFYPSLELTTDVNDPAGCDIVVNATPVGAHDDDPMPLDVERIGPGTWVGEVVMTPEITPFLTAAQARDCRVQIGIDMLFEQIPVYLDYFGFSTTTSEHLRRLVAGDRSERLGESQRPDRLKEPQG
jgi:shikimate dehydrogenase